MTNINYVATDKTAYKLSDWSISDTVTSLIPGNNPGVPNYSISVVDEDRNIFKLIRERVSLHADLPVVGAVSNISRANSSGVASVNVDSDLQMMNKITRIFTVQGELSVATNVYYSIIANMPDSITVIDGTDSAIRSLKAYYPDVYESGLDALYNIVAANNLELYTFYTFNEDTKATAMTIQLRSPATTDLHVMGESDITITVDDTDRAPEVQVENYDYRYVNNGTVWKADSVYQIAAKEYQEVRVTTNATPYNIQQPVCVTTMIPDVGIYDPPSAYVVTGNDGYILSPAYWNDIGGKITAELDPKNPADLIIKIYGPQDISRSPFRISEGEADRPALRIAGTGVMSNKSTVTVRTSDEDAPGDVQTMDNSVIGSLEQAHNIASSLVSKYTGSKLSISGSIPNKPGNFVLLKKPSKGWSGVANNLLPAQHTSAGKLLGSRTGFYADKGLYFTDKLVLDIPLTNTLVKRLFSTDPGWAYDNIDRRYSLSSNILPNQRRSIRRLWLTPVSGATAYAYDLLVSVPSGTANVRHGLCFYDVNFEPLTASTGVAAALTGNNVRMRGSATGAAAARYVAIELFTGAANSTAPTIQIEAAALVQGTTLPIAANTVQNFPETTVTDKLSNFPGSILEYGNNKYRITECTYTPDSISFSGEQHVTLDDLSTHYAGKTLDQLDTLVGTMTFKDFGLEPFVS